MVSGFGVDQESLFEPYAVVPEHRVEALAGVLAGFALKGGRYWADRLATWLAFATGAALLVLAFVTAVR